MKGEIICEQCGNFESECTCHPQGDWLLTGEQIDLCGVGRGLMTLEETYKAIARKQLAKDKDRFLAWLERNGTRELVLLFERETKETQKEFGCH